MHAAAEFLGHWWGGSPSLRGGMAGRHMRSCRPCPAAAQSLPARSPAMEQVAMETLRQGCRPETYRMAGACRRVAGVTGGAAVGRRPQGLPRGPRLAGLLCPSAQLGPAEEKPQSSRVIFSVNRVSLDLRFKTAQLLLACSLGNAAGLMGGGEGKAFPGPVLLRCGLDVPRQMLIVNRQTSKRQETQGNLALLRCETGIFLLLKEPLLNCLGITQARQSGTNWPSSSQSYAKQL